MDIVEILKKREEYKNKVKEDLRKVLGNTKAEINIEGDEIRIFMLINKDVEVIEGNINNLEEVKDKIKRAIANNISKVKDVKDKDIEIKLHALLRKYPAYAKYIERIIEYEEENKDKEYFSMGWSPHVIGANGWEIYQMYTYGIVKLVYDSGRMKGYLLIDRDKTKEAFKKVKEELKIS